ncbi:MAG: hypothetical protein ACR2PR_09570 [Pseudohongiellaceae bacterium]
MVKQPTNSTGEKADKSFKGLIIRFEPFARWIAIGLISFFFMADNFGWLPSEQEHCIQLPKEDGATF